MRKIIGPTASGKAVVAIPQADRLPVKLISVDSAHDFRNKGIAIAKAGRATLARYSHRLIDLI